MTSGTTLYYPYIHPRNIDHLKAALIYWDRVRRIVPTSVMKGDRVHDDNRDAELLTDRKLLISTSPEQYEAAAAKRFFEHVEPQGARFRINVDAARELASRNTGIHIEKLGRGVLGKLQELGLAHRFGDWVTMHDKVGAFYMFCLASEIAKAMSVPLLTDSPNDAALGEALLFEAIDDEQGSDHLLQLGIELPSPAQLARIPLETVVEFTERRAAERQAFRATIEGILKMAASIQDPNAVDDYLSSKRIEITASARDLRQALDEIQVGGLASAVKITVPAGAAAGIAAMPFSPTTAAILAACGIAVAAISCYAETRGRLRQARASSPYHYLTGIKEDLGIDDTH